MCSSKDRNHRYIFISVFSALFPSHCLLSHLVFHWRRGTGGLDADIEMGWESIEACKSNFTTRPTAWKASPLRKCLDCLCKFLCVCEICVDVGNPIDLGWPKGTRQISLSYSPSGFLFSLTFTVPPSLRLFLFPLALSFPPSVPRACLQKYQCVLCPSIAADTSVTITASVEHQHFGSNVRYSCFVKALLLLATSALPPEVSPSESTYFSFSCHPALFWCRCGTLRWKNSNTTM